VPVIIPKPIRRGLATIASCSDVVFDAMLDALTRIPEVLSRDAMFQFTKAEAPKGISPEDFLSVIDSSISLHASLASPDFDEPEFIAAVTSSLDAEENVSVPDRDKFAARLRAILEVRSLAIVAKGVSVIQEFPRQLTGSRVLTDIRPVFGDDPAASLAGAVVVHSLRLQYSEEGRMHNFFVEMDSNDIRALAEVLNRALVKETNLKSLLSTTGVRTLQTFSEETTKHG
jgi:hypothetical protein